MRAAAALRYIVSAVNRHHIEPLVTHSWCLPKNATPFDVLNRNDVCVHGNVLSTKPTSTHFYVERKMREKNGKEVCTTVCCSRIFKKNTEQSVPNSIYYVKFVDCLNRNARNSIKIYGTKHKKESWREKHSHTNTNTHGSNHSVNILNKFSLFW